MSMMLSAAFVSCGSDKKDEPSQEPEPTMLEVNPISISLISSANSSAEITIKCNENWKIKSQPEWINLSSTSGKGDTSITITAISANESASIRKGELIIESGELSETVEVMQLASLQSGCEISIADEVILNTSATFELNFGNKAAYYYAGYFPASSAGWSDSKIITELENSDNAMTAKSGSTITAADLSENTTYVQCMVAYDTKGNRGELFRRSFSTGTSSQAPVAYIEDVSYSDTYWYWTTKIGGRAHEYYMLATSGDEAFYMALLLEPSDIAMLIKYSLTEADSLVNMQDWKRARNNEDNDLLVATWAKRDNKWSSVLSIFWGHISEDEIESNSFLKYKNTYKYEHKSGKFVQRSPEEILNIKRKIRIYKK